MNKRGFALLIAAMVAAVVLLIASSIFDIAQKQVILASISQQSQYAFFAADTGAECALYWDDRIQYFGPGAPNDPDGLLQGGNISCDNQNPAVTNTNAGGPVPPFNPNGGNHPSSPYNYTLEFTVTLNNNAECADVFITKCAGSIDDNGNCTTNGGSTISTQVRANGYNASCANALVQNPPLTILQRRVILNY
ncbi:MAG TPA: pilus assembly PilX N-terminal domain-containing protein [Candidatus Paceibacterota bacterium]|nr:pilus assembly PilX N-terminal domain-containing protein [Candidatus Paceibacterota bacterium]